MSHMKLYRLSTIINEFTSVVGWLTFLSFLLVLAIVAPLSLLVTSLWIVLSFYALYLHIKRNYLHLTRETIDILQITKMGTMRTIKVERRRDLFPFPNRIKDDQFEDWYGLLYDMEDEDY